MKEKTIDSVPQLFHSVESKTKTFNKNERLCSRKLIELLFSSGANVIEFPFRIKYLFVPATDEIQMQALFSIPKKLFKKAVKRNLIRRRAKEVFRINKHLLYEKIPENSKLLLAFIYFDSNIQTFEIIKNGVTNGIEKIIVKITETNVKLIVNSK